LCHLQILNKILLKLVNCKKIKPIETLFQKLISDILIEG